MLVCPCVGFSSPEESTQPLTQETADRPPVLSLANSTCSPPEPGANAGHRAQGSNDYCTFLVYVSSTSSFMTSGLGTTQKRRSCFML
jgi:hypothetical protein